VYNQSLIQSENSLPATDKGLGRVLMRPEPWYL